jgi:invasion protein IalB
LEENAGPNKRQILQLIFLCTVILATNLALSNGATSSAQQVSLGTASGTDAWPGFVGSDLRFAFLHWVKVCVSSRDPQIRTCFTGRDAIDECGRLVGAATLIEPEDGLRPTFRAAVPNAIQDQQGVYIAVDGTEPLRSKVVTCPGYRYCFADFDVAPELIERLKNGQQLILGATNREGNVSSFSIPLAGFAQSNSLTLSEAGDSEHHKDSIQAEIERGGGNNRCH